MLHACAGSGPQVNAAAGVGARIEITNGTPAARPSEPSRPRRESGESAGPDHESGLLEVGDRELEQGLALARARSTHQGQQLVGRPRPRRKP